MNEDGGNENVVGILLLIGGAMFLLPTLIPAVRDGAREWLVEHHVLVGPDAALFQLPFLDAGLDLRRVVIVVTLAALGMWLGRDRAGWGTSRKVKTRA